jgi:hypothetical protein
VEESYLVAGVLLIFGIFTLSWTKLPHYTLPAFPFMALLLAAAWKRDRVFPWAAGGMVAGGLVVTLVGLPLARPLFGSQNLYDQAAPFLSRGMELGMVDYQEPSLVWLFRKKIGGFGTGLNVKEVERWMRKPGPRVCVISTAELGDGLPAIDPSWRVVEAAGFDVSNAHRIEVAAVIKN